MSDEQTPAPEAGAEVVQSPEAEQPQETPEEAQSTEGQETGQPAEGQPSDDEKSRSKVRRERRKAAQAELQERAEKAEAEAKAQRELLTQLAEVSGAEVPKQDDYPDYDQYIAALSAFNAAQAMDARERTRAEREEKSRQQEADDLRRQAKDEARAAFNEQMDDARGRYADFDAVVVNNARLPITEQVAEILFMSEQGADVAYHLGKNPAEAARIARMSPLEAAVAIGRIEATISLPQPRITTTAPEPISPVKPAAAATRDPDKMSMDEWIKARQSGQIR